MKVENQRGRNRNHHNQGVSDTVQEKQHYKGNKKYSNQ
jgi:hypothetical protein